MSLVKLQINHLRNLKGVDLQLSPRVNLFYGANGSGKTSVLEAIHILSLGRSFRSHKHKSLIQFDQSEFTLFCSLNDRGNRTQLGLSRTKSGELSLRADGRNLHSVAQMAQSLPVQIINADSFLLLEGSPQIRRQFMDWLVFHVEHEFYGVWKRLQACLKQRNSLLRCDRIDPLQLAVWDAELVPLTERIHQLRLACFERFLPIFSDLVAQFVAIDGLALVYRSGWEKGVSYADALVASRERDLRLGTTHVGSHRAELKLQIHGQDAADLLSRGQQKLLVCALKIAQGLVFQGACERPCVYLVDDLPAELDSQYRELLVNWLSQMNTQVFVTGVDSQVLRSAWGQIDGDQIKMFHVEHGAITEHPSS